MAGHLTVDVPTSVMKLEILKVIRDQGFINGFQTVEDTQHPTTRVYLKYFKYKPVIKHLKRISKPGLRIYVKASQIGRVRGGMGISVLSTPGGIMTGNDARKKNIGGELLAEIW